MSSAIQSMTGFARVTASTDLGELQVEIKSVNHRFLEIFLRQPEELRVTDVAVRAQLQKALGRGKVDVNMRLTPSAEAVQPLEFNDAHLHRLALACEYMSERVPWLGKVDPLDMLRWPGVLREPERNLESLSAQVVAALISAIDGLKQARGDEGARLAAVLEEKLQEVENLVAAVRERLPEQNRRWREKLLERLKEVAEMEPERQDHALVQFAQRADVDEEMDRLQSHVAEVRACLQKAEPIGRKLDFYMQEFNREANTLGSKSLDAEITRLAVDLKVVIEQMREQVQNIE